MLMGCTLQLKGRDYLEDKRIRPSHTLPKRNTLLTKDRPKTNEQKYTMYNSKQRTGSAQIMLDKIDMKTKSIMTEKEGLFIMIKGLFIRKT